MTAPKVYGEIQHSGHSGVFGEKGLYAIKAEAHVMTRLLRVFPRCEQHRSGRMLIADTPEVASELLWVMQRWPLDCINGTIERLQERAAQYDQRQAALQRLLEGHLNPGPDARVPARPPREYQLVGADLILATGRTLIGDELGLGKSFTSILTLRGADSLPALVVTLTHLPKQWVGELRLAFPDLKAHVIKGRTPYNPKMTRKQGGGVPDVLIINYSCLAGWSHALAGVVRTVIFDEIQELRKSGTQKYVGAGLVADQATYKVGLSATPIYNYGGEIFNVVSILDQDALGTKDEFVREHGGEKVKDPRALGTYLRDQGLFLRRTRKEVGLELPRVQRIVQSCDVDERAAQQLEAGVLDMARLLVNEDSTAKEVFATASSFDWEMRRVTGIAKAPYVAEFVKMLLESGEKVVVWAWHRAVYEILLDRLADANPVMYTGSESPTQKNKAAESFMDDGDDSARVMLMSLMSGAGLDGLQTVCSVGVFAELDWSPQRQDQCVGRLNRDGQKNPVVGYYMISDYGTDPQMAEILAAKRSQSEPLVDPDIELFETTAEPAGDRVKRLAQLVLKRRGVR